MEFCPDCGMWLDLTQKKSKNRVFTLHFCPKCNYQKKFFSTDSSFSRIGKSFTTERIAIIDGESANIRTKPTTKIDYPKCDNKAAFWWMIQTRGADELPTQFFKCTKCMYTGENLLNCDSLYRDNIL